MRLIACHIDNFGKLSNLHMDFEKGINVINEVNGWGKSTLAAFLKAMFYGFDSKKESFVKDRDLYRPWQGGVYGGELDFEIGDKCYRISRSFGRTEKSDEFHLYDLNTNLESNDYSSDIGLELFDLDVASFKRSVFIAQNDCISEASDSINAKLGNLAENTNDINNYESAAKALRDCINSLSPDRVTGSIKKRKKVITTLEHDLKSFDAAETAVREIVAKRDEKVRQRIECASIREEYAKALKIASEESRKKELRKNYEQIVADTKENAQVVSEYQKVFPAKVPTGAEFEEQIKIARQLEEEKTTIRNLAFTDREKDYFEELEQVFKNGVPTDAQIDEALEKVSNVSKIREEYAKLDGKMHYFEAMALKVDDELAPLELPKKSIRKPIGFVLVVLGILVTVFAFTMEYLPESIELPNMVARNGLFLLVLGVGMFGFGISMVVSSYRQEKKKRLASIMREEKRRTLLEEREKPVKELKNQLQEIEQGMEKTEDEVFTFLHPYGKADRNQEYSAKLYELKNQMHEYEQMANKRQQQREAALHYQELFSCLTTFGNVMQMELPEDNIIGELGMLQAKAAEYRLALKNLEASQNKKNEFEATYNVESILQKEECPFSLDELNQMIFDVDEKIEEVRESIEHYNRQLEALQEQLDLRDEKEAELQKEQELQEVETKQYDIVKTTADFLQSAKEQFTARYMAPISKGFEKYYKILTRDEENNWLVDANIELKVKEQGELRETKWLSAGYRDLMGICMRFALVDAMYQDEKPFLVLDDPFVNLDGEKLSHGAELLHELSKEYQVVYFTCHESRECV